MIKRIVLMSALVVSQSNLKADYSQSLQLVKSSIVSLPSKAIAFTADEDFLYKVSKATFFATVTGYIVYKLIFNTPGQGSGHVVSQNDTISSCDSVSSQHERTQQAESTPVAVQAQPETTVVEADPMNYLHNELEWPGKNEITYFE